MTRSSVLRSLLVLLPALVAQQCKTPAWTHTWPFVTEKPNKVKTTQPASLDACLVQLDQILREGVKENFRREDSLIAVINVVERSGGLGSFFIGLWYLDYEPRKAARPAVDHSDIHFPMQTPHLITQFQSLGVQDPQARVRIIFSAYHKKLNGQKYDWKQEVASLKTYWNTDDPKYYRQVIRPREDSIANIYEFNRMEAGDTVSCALLRPPSIFSKDPNGYYLTALINEKRDQYQTIHLRLISVQSSKNTDVFIDNDSVSYRAGDTLTGFPMDWHAKKHRYYNYYKNTYWK